MSPGTHGDVAILRRGLHAEIDVPTIDTIRTSPFREEIEGEWENMLGHQLPQPLPPFADFWSTLDDVFGWLAGTLRIVELPELRSANWTPTGRRPRPSLVEARRPSRVAPLCRSQPPEGRHRLPSRERAMGITASRAVLTALHPRRQPDPLRRQRPGSASELPSRPHRRHPSNDGDLPAQVPSRILSFVTRGRPPISCEMSRTLQHPNSLGRRRPLKTRKDTPENLIFLGIPPSAL